MNWILPDIKNMVIRKNENYWKSVYIGVFGATYNLPIAFLNGLIQPFFRRSYGIVAMYFHFVYVGLRGYADVVTEKEYAEQAETKAEFENKIESMLLKSIETMGGECNCEKCKAKRNEN